MIIGACGFGSTGSSVVSDYLKEYDTIATIDNLEFTWVSATDSLIDLETALMHPHNRTSDSITAIRRFLALAEKKKDNYERHGISSEAFMKSVNEFVDEITQVKWNWYENTNYQLKSKHFLKALMIKKVIPSREKKLGHQIKCWPMEEVRFSIAPENFYTAAKKHVSDLLRAMGADPAKPLVLDQPFPGNNPQACFPFYEDPYAIVVDRDPRDNYVFANTRLLGRNHFMPVQPVEDFIRYYRALRDNQPYLQEDRRVMHLQFEEMVYEYDATTAKLRAFLNLPDNPHPKSIFDPALSVANTQVFRRFPQYEEDIKKIEEALPEYLFDYSKYPAPDPKLKMFYGKSPLNSGKKKV
uniref:Sulfotransferase family protein n=1 Tax=uncultured bacterium Contig248 TaxID=1393544 RepID=W0FNZ9_9BACT|nr:hypothetical protein [uncultured bacterium Contig248]